MDEIGAEGGNADCDVVRSPLEGRAVLNPLAFGGDDGLACFHIDAAVSGRDSQRSFQDQGEFIEFGGLAHFFPADWTAHAGNTGLAGV